MAALGTGIFTELTDKNTEKSSIQSLVGEELTTEKIKKIKKIPIKNVEIIKGDADFDKIGLYAMTLKITTKRNERFEKM